MTIRIGNGAGFLGDNLDCAAAAGRSGRARLSHARISGRADALDPGPQPRKRSRGRLCGRFSRSARQPHARPGRAAAAEDRDQRRRHEPGQLRARQRPAFWLPPAWPTSAIGRGHGRRSARRGWPSCKPPAAASKISTPASRWRELTAPVVSANAYLGRSADRRSAGRQAPGS